MRFDCEGELVNTKLATYFEKREILHGTTVGYALQSIGVAERLNRTLLKRMRGMVFASGLPGGMWAKAIVTASYLRNRSSDLTRLLHSSPYKAETAIVSRSKDFKVARSAKPVLHQTGSQTLSPSGPLSRAC